jgi:hypothetical protein
MYTTTDLYIDGFGAQYLRIIALYILSKYNNWIFHYRPFSSMEHNYENDPLFIEKKEELINLKNNIENIDSIKYKYENIHHSSFLANFEHNIDLCYKSEQMAFLKKCFWEKKEKDIFKNCKINVAVHIRRLNSHDGGTSNAGIRISTPNLYYLNIMNKIRSKYADKNLLFHIYSQGNTSDFLDLVKINDTELHLNADVESTFTSMVAADILVTSPSCLSYVAALLSDGEIWYKKFWHPPVNDWIVNL